MSEQIKNAIAEGRTALGIEFGSTRIKAVLIDENHSTIALGTHTWENRLENGIWPYRLDDIWTGHRIAIEALHRMFRKNMDLPCRK